MARLQVTVVTPEKQVTKGEVDQVVAPSAMGQVGILPNHRPLLAELVPGIVELWTGERVERLATAGGYLEVDRNQVRVLVETAERPDEVDLERAQKALSDAEGQLKKASPLDPEYADAQQKAERARVRVAIATAR
jgi:F-type H+-transporting ATPase subunit epsilon